MRRQLLYGVMLLFTIISLHAQNTTLPVGTVPGSEGVSSMGAATYTIPIEVVPGTHGVQPELSVVYNSMTSCGILGEKCDLAGVSCISRVGRTEFLDHVVSSVSFNNKDRFSLDGNRLVCMDPTQYGLDGTTYYTEFEDFSTIVSYGTIGLGPAYFKVFTHDGAVIEYGYSEDSRQMTSNGVLNWFVSKYTDIHGNFMTFEYAHSGNEIWIEEINYTGNEAAGLHPYARVRFEYDSSCHIGSSFVGGQQIRHTHLLHSIIVEFNNGLEYDNVRQYNFTYSTSFPKKLLSVDLYAQGVSALLNPTEFQWENPSFGSVDTIMIPNSPFDCHRSHVAIDFNKDGYCDIVEYDAYHCYYFSNVNNSFQWVHTSGTLQQYYILQCIPADVDGDGISELLTVFKNTQNKVFVTSSYMEGNDVQSVLMVDTFVAANRVSAYTGDFYGNGKQQILLLINDTAMVLADNNHFSIMQGLSHPILTMDFDGDGQMEIMEYGRYLSIYKYNVDSHHISLYKRLSFSGGTIVNNGDFNGDGISDLLCRKININNEYVYCVAFGTGDGFTTVTPLNVSISHTASAFIPLVLDINCDGYDDIVAFAGDEANGVKMLHYLGRGFYHDTLYFNCNPNAWMQNPYLYTSMDFSSGCNYFTIGDFDNDYAIDILCSKDLGLTGNAFFVYRFGAPKQQQKLCKVEKGDGSFCRWNFVGIRGLHFKYASFMTITPYYYDVVDTMIITGGSLSELHKSHYIYEQPIYSSRRRQLMGFCKTVVVDETRQMSDTILYANVKAYDVWQDVLLPIKRVTVRGATPITSATYQSECVLRPLNRRMPFVRESEVINHIDNTVTIQKNTLSPDGFLSGASTAVQDEFTHEMVTKDSVKYHYTSIALSNGAVIKPIDTTINLSYMSGSTVSLTHIQMAAYSPSGNKVSSTLIANGTSVTEQYGAYDAFGNPATVTLSSQGLASRTQTFSYDATGRFVLLETNALGHQTSRLYDPATGLVLSETDPNGLITRYSYDAFGRPDTIRYPDHTMRTFSYRWYVGSSIPAAKTYTVTAMTGQSNTEKYFDLLGRVVCTRQEGYYTDTRYNPTGTVLKTSAPYTSLHTADADKLWHTWQYDHLDRPTAEQGPHTDLSYSYTGRTVTTTDNLRQSTATQTTDAAGRPLSVTDPGGTIGYQYALDTYNGRPVLRTTITANGNATVLLSDVRGNRLSIADPDAGTITCTYNAYGELRAQTDAREVTTSFAYDALGRVTNKTYANTDGILKRVAYSYDHYTSANRGRGRLYQVTMDNHPSEQFLYDTLGRLAEHTRYAEGLPYTDSYTYNSKSQVATRSFPDGYTMSYSYLSSGRMESVSLGNTRLLKVYGYNMYGQPSLCEYGNGLFTQRTYGPTGLLTRINTGEKHDVQFEPIVIQSLGDSPNLIVPDDPGPVIIAYTVDSTVQNLRYSYDAMGRLTRRSQMNSRYETFQYDNLDRLTAFGQGMVNNGTPQTYSTVYDGQGNIQSHTLAGSYQYEGAQPHAVTEVTPSADYPDAISAAQCATEYNCHNQPSHIAEGDVEILLEYDAEGQRSKAVFKRNGQEERTRYYMGDYEREVHANGTVTHYHYVSGPMGLAAMVVTRGGADSIFYVHPDRLGSITHITNSAKQVVRALHFDPWGNVKSDADWTVFADTVLADTSRHFRLERGFTGHEHYTELKIINMNGRLYDPVIARFFSPDNFVQAPGSTQGYNRYSYCLNNPLQWVDPSGESLLAVAFVIGSFINVFFQTISGNINSASDFMFSAVIGGLAGMAGSAAGSAAFAAVGVGGFLGGTASGAASGSVAGAINGFGNALLSGQDLGTSFGYGYFGGFIGALSGGLTGGLYNGISDAIHGYSFLDGSRIDEFIMGEEPMIQDYKLLASMYDKSDIADYNDMHLAYRINKVFGVQRCDFNIDVITTRTEGYGLTTSGYYINKKGILVGGYVRSFSSGSSDMHISPYFTSASDIEFKAVVGHELIHSYHYYILGDSFQRIWSEMVAYRYTYNTYIRGNDYVRAFTTLQIAMKNHYWSTLYPSNYNIPTPYLFY
ncbi:MAG: hypothetical protein J6T86_00650 [Bacteroidales bacterium]|nr:hypothetical protein [Bacteroidales bacterium]